MNKRQLKKFNKKCGLKRYDTLGKLHEQGKSRLFINGKWRTAVVAMVGDCVNKNRRYYSMDTVMKSITSLIQDENSEVSKQLNSFKIDFDHPTPSFSTRTVSSEVILGGY